MKTLLKLSLLLVVALTTFTSCKDDDGYSLDKFWISYGVSDIQNGRYTVILDNGDKLSSVVDNGIGLPTVSGQRVLVNYTILDDETVGDRTNYFVRINAIQKILTKNPLHAENLTAHQQDSIGHDRIDVESAWFGNKFLNINFLTKRYDPYLAHFINLVVLDDQSDDTEVVVELRHNAYGDGVTGKYYTSYGRVAFDISSLIPEGKDEIKVVLKYINYNGETKVDDGIFKREFFANSNKTKLTTLKSIPDSDKSI